MRLDLDVVMGRRPKGSNERRTGSIPLEPEELIGRQYDDSGPPVHRHVLRAFVVGAPHDFAEARLRVLQRPGARLPSGSRRMLRFSGHADQSIRSDPGSSGGVRGAVYDRPRGIGADLTPPGRHTY